VAASVAAVECLRNMLATEAEHPRDLAQVILPDHIHNGILRVETVD
jgi:hypothetical protein